jgi:hypothetical protein
LAYLLKARTVEPEKRPLLMNGSEKYSFLRNGRKAANGTTPVARYHILDKQEYTAAARERLGKHFPPATEMHRKMNGVVFGRAVSRSYKEDNWGNQVSSVRSLKKREEKERR